jgi:hypothetical protein
MFTHFFLERHSKKIRKMGLTPPSATCTFSTTGPTVSNSTLNSAHSYTPFSPPSHHCGLVRYFSVAPFYTPNDLNRNYYRFSTPHPPSDSPNRSLRTRRPLIPSLRRIRHPLSEYSQHLHLLYTHVSCLFGAPLCSLLALESI